MTEPLRIDVWSDVVCPWCYLGKRRMEVAIRELRESTDIAEVEVFYHSFQLNPELPADTDVGDLEYLATHKGIDESQARAAHERITELGSAVGLEYDFDSARVANTHLAHQLIHFAADHDAQAEVKERLFRAHFTEGRHVGALDTLVEIAAEAGLDPVAAREALESGQYADAVEQDKYLATRLGIRGVPFFIFEGKVGVSGAHEPEVLLDAIRQAREA